MDTYIEKINRFVVEYHEELPREHKAQYRLNGIDPDTLWNLKWSFETLEDAEAQAQNDRDWQTKFCAEHGYKEDRTYRVRDLGATQYIERSVW